MSKIETVEEFERRKFEEALEVKSLRRIISAYLNYPEAAEEDVKRWERSFAKLPPHHKALLSHIPLKFQKLKCIYIEIISKVLKDGGVWINLGPLLYHFADMYGPEDEMSIDLSLEDVKGVALHYGFIFEKESTIETTYTTNPRSMMQESLTSCCSYVNRYYAAFWTMRKKTKEIL